MSKIFIYTNRFDVKKTGGGASQRIEGLTRYLSPVIYHFIGPVKPNYIDKKNYSYLNFNRAEWWLFKLFNYSNSRVLKLFLKSNKKLLKLVELIDNNYLLSHKNKTLALVLKTIFDQKIIFDIHGLTFLEQKYNKNSVGLIQTAINKMNLIEEINIFKKSNYLNAVSEEMKELLIERFSINPSKIFIVPDGKLDTSSAQKSSNNNGIIKRIKSKSNGKFVVGFIGNFKKLGGIAELIEAFCLLDKEKYFFLIIGRGQEEHHLKKLSPENSFHITRVDYAELLDYQQCADILVCPDHKDNLYNQVCPHIKVYDSLMSHRKTLTTDFKFWHDIQKKFPHNLYLSSSTVESLKKSIEDINSNYTPPETLPDEFISQFRYSLHSSNMLKIYKQTGIIS